MIVNIINIPRIAFDEAENDPPIRTDSNRPKTLEVTFERVQAKAWDVHIRDRSRSIKTRENVPQPIRMLANQTAGIAVLVKAFQSLMADRSDHVLL